MRSTTARSAILGSAMLALAGCGGAPHGSTISGEPGAALSRDDVAIDLEVLERTFDEAYAGRAFITDETWASMRVALSALREDTRSRWLCHAMGDALGTLTDPGIAVRTAEGEGPCLSMASHGAWPRWGGDFGEGIAADAEASFVVRLEGDVMVLGVRAFAPSDDPGWAGLDRAVSDAARATALIVDLRGARGNDPSALIPLVEALTGRAPVHPIASIVRAEGETASALRSAAQSLAVATPPLPADAWASLIGQETHGDIPHRHLTVLFDGACEEACEMVTRLLEAYAGAETFGAASSERRLSRGEPGVLTLPRSRLQVTIPTRVVVLSPELARATGDRGSWFRGQGYASAAQVAAARHDRLPHALETMQREAEGHARTAAFVASPPPPCDSFLEITRPEDLPPEAAAKLDDASAPGEETIITATLDLPAELATSYVSGCPGITITGTIGREPATMRIDGPFAALSRLLQSDAVRSVRVEIDHPVHID